MEGMEPGAKLARRPGSLSKGRRWAQFVILTVFALLEVWALFSSGRLLNVIGLLVFSTCAVIVWRNIHHDPST